jgi:hypothetical protein
MLVPGWRWQERKPARVEMMFLTHTGQNSMHNPRALGGAHRGRPSGRSKTTYCDHAEPSRRYNSHQSFKIESSAEQEVVGLGRIIEYDSVSG